MMRVEERAKEITEYSRESKYWLFRPAWQIDTAFWSGLFGEHDPAAVIAFYIKNMFKPDENDSEPLNGGRSIAISRIELLQVDTFILEWLLGTFADYLSRTRYRGEPHGASQCQFLRALILVCGLEEVIDDALTWRDTDFCQIVSTVPQWISSKLVSYWASQSFSDLPDDTLYEVLAEEAHFIGAAVVRYVGKEPELQACEPPLLDYISDWEIDNILHNLRDLEDHIEGACDLHDTIVREICAARQTRFGGVLPFSFNDSGYIIGRLRYDDRPYWLSYIVNYGPGHDQDYTDPFWVFAPTEAANKAANRDRRTDPRAVNRFHAFRSALSEIERERLDELAAAWWAFFIASQAIAFQGLGLPAPLTAEVASISRRLLQHEALRKAISFARDICRQHADPLEARSTVALLAISPGIAFAQKDSATNVVDFAVPKAQVERFLEVTIGENVWSKLNKQSRHDLVEAEQLWSRAALEFGAGRLDWGSLVALYARAIEAEVRAHVLPVVTLAAQAGLCELAEPTLGGCVQAVRKAKKSVRKGAGHALPNSTVATLELLGDFFAEQNSFLESFRNRASHGNREHPIRAEEFARWRETMFQAGLFKVLIEATSADTI